MAMPENPLRSLREDEIEAFHRDGVICVRNVMPSRWIDLAAEAIERTRQQPSKTGKILSKPAPGYLNDIFMWLRDDGHRTFVLESPAARLAQQAMRSQTVTFFYDQVFAKEPGTNVPTPWHHDLTFWPIEGTQICSIWMPVDSVTRASSGLEYVRGSHRWNRRFKAVSPDYHPDLLASDLEDPPDIDAHRTDYDLVNWDMEPGDVLMFHPLTLHGSAGNSSTTQRRRALATRWLGDDVVYAPAKARMPLPPQHGLAPGDRLRGRYFPRILG
ncbi:MAG TPA: phytanoyl-CoA dioxygenase family protein [Candidatus Binataceae bacterium]|nr:phytanoyl-CoA dioxygenase family protein [Candidatus Binataceae bacterium]